MPIHDWTRVSDGAFHAFHHCWIGEIRTALNSGVLPPGYYAQAEQVIGRYAPDTLVLQEDSGNGHANGDPRPQSGGVALADARPAARVVAEAADPAFARRQRSVAIRHASDDRIVA